jgi:hypothetical protein
MGRSAVISLQSPIDGAAENPEGAVRDADTVFERCLIS